MYWSVFWCRGTHLGKVWHHIQVDPWHLRVSSNLKPLLGSRCSRPKGDVEEAQLCTGTCRSLGWRGPWSLWKVPSQRFLETSPSPVPRTPIATWIHSFLAVGLERVQAQGEAHTKAHPHRWCWNMACRTGFASSLAVTCCTPECPQTLSEPIKDPGWHRQRPNRLGGEGHPERLAGWEQVSSTLPAQGRM